MGTNHTRGHDSSVLTTSSCALPPDVAFNAIKRVIQLQWRRRRSACSSTCKALRLSLARKSMSCNSLLRIAYKGLYQSGCESCSFEMYAKGSFVFLPQATSVAFIHGFTPFTFKPSSLIKSDCITYQLRNISRNTNKQYGYISNVVLVLGNVHP